ncbi:hypothetical protein [Pseudoalteromonas piscicida]|uniref:hypothetical protein n=1 Tax=Pseudoalteromonas piscicida TaxID=43662 RepID=UPI0005F9FD24|nr:hypothetical protein [Pseudoalteromonas piscicida]KJZ04302.1 hypothetical protein TW73_04335 [Pseudoalteromonas piscicida]QZO15666.1 hypothetical protein K5642_20720 [Pseudoalteromonas piscicida]
MNIKINLTNRYDFELLIYPFNGGNYPSANDAQKVAQKEGEGEIVVKSGECGVVDIPGMGSLLIQFLGEQRLESIHDRFCENPSDFDKYEQMALLRYKTTELYWRFPTSEDDAQLQLSVNELGTVCLDKVLTGEALKVSLPEFFIPPVFNAGLPGTTNADPE